MLVGVDKRLVVDYSDVLKTVLIEVRDIFRADSTLLSTLGITSGTAKDHIFFNRPTDQKGKFKLPRIVCEAPFHLPINYNDNPEGFQDDIVNFVATLWISETPTSTAYEAADRMRVLLDNTDFNITEGGTGHFNVTSVNVAPDGDRDNVLQCQVLTSAESIITDGA